MTDFNEIIDLSKDVITVFKGLHNMFIYDGPITMQYLPYGGVQSVFGGNIIITTKMGFIASKNVTYDGIDMSSDQFISIFNDLVNTILPDF